MLFFGRKKQPTHNPDEIIKEKWQTSFGWLAPKRLSEEESDFYTSYSKKGTYNLELYKKNFFAWVTSPLYKYNDFVLEANASFNSENDYSALGFVLRHLDDSNFYYFLISNQGFFRFDLVLNGNPIPLIEWTNSPEISGQQNSIRIIANLDQFAFFIDDSWVGEVSEESIREGHIGFTGQNYLGRELARFHLHDLLIESRPIEVEKAYTRWVTYIPANPEYRINLAETFYRRGKLLPAAVQIRKALQKKRGSFANYFFLAEILVQLGLYQEALEAVEKALSLEPDHPEAKQEKANLLYLLNKLPEAKAYITVILPDFKDNAVLWNQLGNTEYAMNNWEQAKAAYLEASRIEPDRALFKVNVARAFEMVGDLDNALEYYLAASRQYFKEEAYDELEWLFPKLEVFAPDEPEVLSLEGKIRFHRGEYEEAAGLFEELLEEESEDSAVHFLYGLILSRWQKKTEALPYLQKACELEPNFPIYWLRLAEVLFELGRNPEQELKKAYTLDPNDPWINNLYGLYLMQPYQELSSGEMATAGESALASTAAQADEDQAACTKAYNDALAYFAKAYQFKPGEVDIIINFTDCLAKVETLTGKAVYVAPEGMFSTVGTAPEPGEAKESANQLLAVTLLKHILEDEKPESAANLFAPEQRAKLYNHWGNLLVARTEYNQAYYAYEKALQVEPDNIDYLKNCASLCIELDMIMQAEELLNHLLNLQPDAPGADVYNLIAHLALVQGEANRAELALKAGLEAEPENHDLKLNLAAFYIQSGNYEKAKSALQEFGAPQSAVPVAENISAELAPPVLSRVQSLWHRLHDKFDKKLSCAECDRVWWAPLVIPPQPPFKLHGEPPGECPAGQCPTCGKIYCIACAARHVVESRFVCPTCNQFLKIADQHLKFLILQYVNAGCEESEN